MSSYSALFRRDMMTTVVTRTWQAVRPHVPLIKFRKGSAVQGHVDNVRVVAAAAPTQSSSKPSFKPVQKGPIIEDWQLPLRYRRQALSQQEVDYINRGGPE
ncbi:alpha-ketoglutarate dehydrogenase component 4 [Neocloeon triangulifer]|uniref:alpha-ketoglutarate dehydrogenase component 4 n=1 Tax=Neocloeon triangulifer TaxID=2078957 RepID=UPI00286ED991|nr:alpha-ketoglutarate dehydrogenase component 4 [Neocloeon triangulifer]